jgi:tyrosine-protein kinase Etk/Wzc
MDSVSPFANRGGDSVDETGAAKLLLLAVELARYRFIWLGLPLLCAVLALAGAFLIPNTFISRVKILPPTQVNSMGSMLGALTALQSAPAGLVIPGLKNPADQWVGMLGSRTIADALVDQFDLMKYYEEAYRYKARNALAASTKINARKDGLIDIEVEDLDPKIAAAIADAYVAELRKLSRSMAITEAAQRRLFLEKQWDQAKNKLTQAESALRQTGVKPDVMRASPEMTVGALAQAQARIAAKEVELVVMRKTMTYENVQFQAVLAELSLLKKQYEDLQKQVPSNGSDDYISRLREYKYQEALFDLISKQYAIAKADEDRDGALIQVVDKAEVPERKANPRRAMYGVTGFFLGAFLAVLVCLYRIVLRDGVVFPEISSIYSEVCRVFWGRGSKAAI